MLRIGLTGGIGAGKSAVSATFADCGAVIVDGDVIAREVVEPGTEGLASLVDAFGNDILLPDGALDRPALAAKAFRTKSSARSSTASCTRWWASAAPRSSPSVRRGCGCRRGHSAAGRVRDGAVVPAGRHRARRCRSAASTAGRATRHDRGRRPGPDRRAGHRRTAPRRRRRLAGQLGQPRGAGGAGPRVWHNRILPFAHNLAERRPRTCGGAAGAGRSDLAGPGAAYRATG